MQSSILMNISYAPEEKVYSTVSTKYCKCINQSSLE